MQKIGLRFTVLVKNCRKIDSVVSGLGLRYSSVLSDFLFLKNIFLVRGAFLGCRRLAYHLIMTIGGIGGMRTCRILPVDNRRRLDLSRRNFDFPPLIGLLFFKLSFSQTAGQVCLDRAAVPSRHRLATVRPRCLLCWRF